MVLVDNIFLFAEKFKAKIKPNILFFITSISSWLTFVKIVPYI